MSELDRFAKMVHSDTTIMAEVDALKGFADVVTYAKAKGFEITEDDLRNAVPPGKGLSDEELDQIAAGNGNVSISGLFY